MSDDNPAAAPTSFTCPVCGMTSGHPTDVAEGYCGNCHDWTGGTPAASFTCPRPDCGAVITTPLAAAAGYCWACGDWTGAEPPSDVTDDAMCVEFAVPRPYGRGARAGGAGGP